MCIEGCPLLPPSRPGCLQSSSCSLPNGTPAQELTAARCLGLNYSAWLWRPWLYFSPHSVTSQDKSSVPVTEAPSYTTLPDTTSFLTLPPRVHAVQLPKEENKIGSFLFTSLIYPDCPHLSQYIVQVTWSKMPSLKILPHTDITFFY